MDSKSKLEIMTTDANANANVDVVPVKSRYDQSKKLDMVKKINKIKKKEYLLDIFKIIAKEEEYSENNNGVFMFFHKLSDELYDKVDAYVNMIYKTHKISNVNAIFSSEISDTFNDASDSVIEISMDKNLSNKEKTILRRKKYEEYLIHNQNQNT
ncbi:MAG: hypothetical protein Gaeavirus4_5 [Gaeavirus sp.]|uniref:NET domain-containing protein n=1 Tax=Gaeavirus sp. TaxID=2487767 RepID=A0A3G4ZYL5_9VIRU|nr:MAG: hypothetical protein Gaeavirus4_5 [Gaeavirus sp.]